MGEILELSITINGKTTNIKIDKTMMDEQLSHVPVDRLDKVRTNYIMHELEPFIFELLKDIK